MIPSLIEWRDAHCSDGTRQRDFMHVFDVGRAFAAVLDSDIIRTCQHRVGLLRAGAVGHLDSRFTHQASDLIRFGVVNRPNEPPRFAASIDILHGQLGFRPVYDLETGLANTVDWWRSRRARSGRL